MIWILWVALAILWTIVCLAAGYAGGRESAKEELAEAKKVRHIDITPIPMTFNQTAAVDQEDVYRAAKKILEENPPKMPPLPELPGPEMWRVDENFTLPEWVEHVNSRLSRVERKAGLNV